MSGTSDPQPIEQSRPSGNSDIVYVGYCRRDRATVEEQPSQEQLTPERILESTNRSPSGFSWRCADNGPAQLVLALLLDYADDKDVTLGEYMEFKTKVASQLKCTKPDDCWRFTRREIDTALRETTDELVAPSVN